MNLAFIWLTASLFAAGLSFSYKPDGQPGRPGTLKPAKLARFLHVLGVKKVTNWLQNNLIMVSDNYANCIYHNHEIQIPPKTRKKRYLQMINDLQRHFENADNFLHVQGCKPKVAIMPRLQIHQLRYINLTERILRGLSATRRMVGPCRERE